MKDSFQKRADESGRRVVDDVRAMRALGHPDRLSVLLFVMSARSRTATECAAEVGISPSACSYHLRELERFGFAERVDDTTDGRRRPWRASAVGFSVGHDWSDTAPAVRAARHAVGRAELMENQRLVERYVGMVDEIDARWRNAADFHTYELVVTSDELEQLNVAVRRLMQRFRAPERTDLPDDAAAVHVVYQAFPRLPSP